MFSGYNGHQTQCDGSMGARFSGIQPPPIRQNSKMVLHGIRIAGVGRGNAFAANRDTPRQTAVGLVLSAARYTTILWASVQICYLSKCYSIYKIWCASVY